MRREREGKEKKAGEGSGGEGRGEADCFGLSFYFSPEGVEVDLPESRRQKTWCTKSLDTEVLEFLPIFCMRHKAIQ